MGPVTDTSARLRTRFEKVNLREMNGNTTLTESLIEASSDGFALILPHGPDCHTIPLNLGVRRRTVVVDLLLEQWTGRQYAAQIEHYPVPQVLFCVM